ncbi:DNA/RNA non-specific endonuclease [Oscillospiraceae bacterium N12]|uniref:DNA/RNA non-specific endonuclease n=1 Tax=Jilunia laotingensis TaxID=2763675 RepID=A0A926F8R6_9BACT|nr:DNA/RNA non-specific endonuclease [Jilunia laotingensis]
MNHKNPSKKKKSWTFPKLSSTIIIIGLIPIIYGIFLYCLQNTSIIPNTSNVIKSQKVPKATELERPLLLSPKQEQIVHHTGYIVSYNESLRLPNWVAYELTRQETQGNAKRSNRFIPDPMIKGTIATNSDYLHSGYDKGHMAPAADMKWSSIAMKESFYFSNICPQHPELNRKKWKDLEDKIRDWAIEDSAIIIICGPIVDKTPKVIGKNKVVIPQQFFKAILSPFTQPPKAIGFLFTNEQSVSPLSNYAVSVDSIEILTGMDFFSPLPDHIEDSIEAHLNINQWNL